MGGILVEAIFHRNVVEEGLLLSCKVVLARRYLAANLYFQAVVEEAFGELEGVVCMRVASGVGAVVDTNAEIECLQGRTSDAVDLAL